MWKRIKKHPIKSTIFFSILGFLIAILFFNCFPDVIVDNTVMTTQNTSSAVAEIHGFFYFLSGAGTVLLVWVAYGKIGSISQTAKAEFLLRIDERWTSPEITETRIKLWKIYRNERKRIKGNCSKKCKKEAAIEKVGEHIWEVHKGEAKEKQKQEEELNLLFEYLNFMELMGAIYEMKEQGLIDDDLLEHLFGQKLEIYAKFYQVYFEKEFNCDFKKENKDAPPAAKLLKYFLKQDKRKTG